MKILFISRSGDSLPIAQRVQDEGHSSSLFILEKKAKKIGDGIVSKPKFTLPLTNNGGHPVQSNVKQLLSKTSPDFVIFDTVKLGKVADSIRSSGIPILGACRWADEAELDRSYGYKLMKQVGIQVPPTTQFSSGQYQDAISFINKHKDKRYVYKPSGNIETSHTYVSEGSEDMIGMLKMWKSDKCDFELQEVVEGVEVSCELWWNGLHSSVHNITFEEKKFMNDNIGPAIGCAGNVVKMVSPKMRIVKEGIGKMERLLKKTTYRGPIDLNMIATPTKLYGLEFTVRMGYDAIQALFELHKGSTTEFLYNIASGGRNGGEFTSDYSIAVRLSIPPYPYDDGEAEEGVPIIGVNNNNAKHVWWGDAMKDDRDYVSAGAYGSPLSVTARGRDVQECRRRVYRTIDNLTIPQVQYRTDIGERVTKDEKTLKSWGYF